MTAQMNIKISIILGIIVLNILLVSCIASGKTVTSPTATKPLIPPKITIDTAITIAKGYVPTDVLSNTEISYTTDPLDTNDPIGWVIMFNFNTVKVTSEQLLKFGWIPDSDTDFSPPNSSYLWLIITVNANTGDIIHKSATNNSYLGIPPPS